MRFRSLLALAAVTPLLIAAAEPVRLQPSSQWVLDYADDSCRLIRMFGGGEDQTKFMLESIAPGEMSMLAVGRPLRASFGAAAVKARFLPGQDYPFIGTPAEAEQGAQPAALWSHIPLMPILKFDGPRIVSVQKLRTKAGVRPPPMDLAKRAAERAERLAFVAKANELEIETRTGHPVILETGSLGEPIRMFDECMRDLGSGPIKGIPMGAAI